ncbi:PAS domain S-box protein [Leeuwenhoekiella sp. H156]|uniref:sensor histidine kinase n=1 Tax=Leeuwenhoekiella sp. H156 TaxID=3450128 RepID=UPI003FA44169
MAAVKTSQILIEAIREMPGVFAIVDKDLALISKSKEWDAGLLSYFSTVTEDMTKLQLKFKTAFEKSIQGENSYFIQNIPQKQVRYKYKFSRIDPEPCLILIQQVLLTRPQDYRKELLLQETNKVAEIGFWEYNIITGKIYWSEVTRKIHEVPEDFVPNLETGVSFYKEGENRERISRAVQNGVETGEPWNGDYTIINHKGRKVHVNARGKAEFENGKCVRLLGTFQDITERTERNIRLKKSEEQFRLAFENSPIGFLIISIDGFHLLRSNRAFQKLIGLGEKELVNKKLTDFFAPEEANRYYLNFLKLIDGKLAEIQGEHFLRNTNGVILTCSVFASVIYDPDAKPKEIIVQIQDVTELRRKSQEIDRFVEVTTEQNTRLINFAHIVSHNLRSHTSNIAMLLNFLKEEKDLDERELQLDMLNQASDMLTETIKHLNEVVSVDIDIKDKEELVLKDFVKNTERSLRGLLVNANFKIYNYVPEDLKVYAVPAYLESVLLNLFSNSIKYRDPRKKSWLQVTAEAVNGYTVISVSDNGLGINMERYGDRIFGLYKTFHEHSEARGLGLYMTQSQIQVMGGSIDVKSKVGEGTTFIIKLHEKDKTGMSGR